MKPDLEGALRELERVEEIEGKKMQDRTKAIVEAAEAFVAASQMHIAHDKNDVPFVMHEAIDDGVGDFCDDVSGPLLALVRAISLPSPQWTRTPPSEPGTYWIRGPDKVSEAVTLYRSGGSIDGALFFRGLEEPVYLSDLTNEEWWPVRVEEPPA